MPSQLRCEFTTRYTSTNQHGIYLMMRISFAAFCFLLLLTLVSPVRAQSVDTKLLGEMHWRNVGPFRGGRTRAVSGVPSQPNVFYVGAVNGGVWKTTDFGRTWDPIFDREPTGSIGAIAVAPPIPISFTSAAAKGCTVPISPSAMASISPPTAAQPGRILACATASRFRRLPSIPRSQPPLRRRRRASLRPQSRTRRLSLHRRRSDLPEGALQGREHRRLVM